MTATPSLLDDFNQFVHEAFPKREPRPRMSKHKRTSIWLGVLMFVAMLGGTGIAILVSTLTGNGYFMILIVPSVALGFLIATFGDWYDKKYRL